MYPFEFNLPIGIPTSYSTPEVRVCYDIEAILERSWKPNFKARVPFTVTGILDLNELPEPGKAFGIRVSKNLYCCFCNSGSVGFEVKLARQGYVCGEYVEIVIELFNQSSKEIRDFSLCLVQVMWPLSCSFMNERFSGKLQIFRYFVRNRSTVQTCTARRPYIQR